MIDDDDDDDFYFFTVFSSILNEDVPRVQVPMNKVFHKYLKLLQNVNNEFVRNVNINKKKNLGIMNYAYRMQRTG